MKIIIDADEWIADMENGKYKINDSAYAKGCNDVLNYYIEKLKGIVKESKQHLKSGFYMEDCYVQDGRI